MLYKLFIKYSLLVNICIIYAAIPVQAKSMYVTDVLKVTLRTGPNIENKIIEMVESGLWVIMTDQAIAGVKEKGGK